jgi:MFS family permease
MSSLDVATPPETGRITTITTILISTFFLGGGSALQGSALVLRGVLEGFSDPVIGLISSSYYAGVLAGSFIAIPVIRNVGYIRTFAAFASLGSASAIAHILWIQPIVWVALRLIHGISFAVVLVVVESWINVVSPTAHRGRILSIYSITYLASIGIVQPLLGVFPPASFELFGITTILISLCILPVTLANVSSVATVARVRIRMAQIIKRSPLGVGGVLASGIVAGAHFSLAPRFGQNLGLQDGSIGLFLLIISLGTVVMQWPLGILSDAAGRRTALTVSASVGCTAAVAMSFSSGSGVWLTTMAFLFGGFALPLYSLSIAAVNDQLLADEMVQSAGALYVIYGIGSMFGPIVAAGMMDWAGPAALYWLVALVLLVYLLFLLLQQSLHPEFAVRGDTEEYHSYPRSTIVSLRMLQRFVPRTNAGRRGTTSPKPEE